MLQPRVAPVRPRVFAPDNGEVVLLEDVVQSLSEKGWKGTIRLKGGFGSGKTTALAHLAAVLPENSPVVLNDDNIRTSQPSAGSLSDRSLYTQQQQPSDDSTIVLQLAPWTDDDLIEYLLAFHHEKCASVFSRCGTSHDKAFLQGIPQLWSCALDALAENESLASIRAALRRVVISAIPTENDRELAAEYCMVRCFGQSEHIQLARAELLFDKLKNRKECETLCRLLRHPSVWRLFGAEYAVSQLRGGEWSEILAPLWSLPLLDEVASLIRDDAVVLDFLRHITTDKKGIVSQPTAASLIHAAAVGWKPERQIVGGLAKWLLSPATIIPHLKGAVLQHANWPRIDLSRMQLTDANLDDADLSEANLDGARAERISLRRANLSGASIGQIQLNSGTVCFADFSHTRGERAQFRQLIAGGAVFTGALLFQADFTGADLKGAVFSRADLEEAEFTNAQIDGADFSHADLSGATLTRLALNKADFRQATFCHAFLVNCDLEGMELPGADFSGAYLSSALLTRSYIPGGIFLAADLTNTGLADIDWENADLRDADLRGAAFHFGSSRSGLVSSPIASLGTRTGFYTDEYNEQDFKAPEEIRKANLRGADLRGAKITGVDFYLVDLREAKYDADQENNFSLAAQFSNLVSNDEVRIVLKSAQRSLSLKKGPSLVVATKGATN